MISSRMPCFPRAWENVAFGLKREAWQGTDIQQRSGRNAGSGATARLPNASRTNSPSVANSSGVALATSLAKRPKLCYDTLGALDKLLREQTQFELVIIEVRRDLRDGDPTRKKP
jgi:ABC-type Fe3+/spermidine/putrescine transport system ATPase subunit